MTDVLTTIARFINSPPGQLAAGGVLAGIVWKFFERVEGLLTEATKFEIAVWLVGRKKVGPKVQPWPDTFAKIFDRVFGEKHLTWRCFWRSCVASYCLLLFILFLYLSFIIRLPGPPPHLSPHPPPIHGWPSSRFLGLLLIVPLTLFTNAIPDYLSLLESRIVLRFMTVRPSGVVWILAISLDFWLTLFIGFLPIQLLSLALIGRANVRPFLDFLLLSVLHPFGFAKSVYTYARFSPISIFPAFFTSIWLWLYAGAGFLLKSARRFDIGFDWFNRKFDIEKKPLQSIGLVAGALVAVVYWVAMIVGRVVR